LLSILYLTLAGVSAGVIVNRFLRRQCPHNLAVDGVVGAALSTGVGLLYGYLLGVGPLQTSRAEWLISFAAAIVALYLWCMLRVAAASRA
jgi:hypothetical protein